MKFRKTVLDNGVRIITSPMEGNPTVTVMVGVATGAFNETADQAGISHFLEHMGFKGTARRPSSRIISTELDSIGAGYNAFTSEEMTGYYAKADTSHFNKIADVVADIYLDPILPEAEIVKEKKVVWGEIDMYADDPQERIAEALRKHMYKGEQAERDVLGTKQTVATITRESLVEYRTRQYTGPNTVVTIAGGVPEKEMLEWATKAFSKLPKAQATPSFATIDRVQKVAETVFVDKDTDQAHMVLAWRTFPRTNPDRFVVRVIQALLRGGMSSRLFIRLRDEMGSGYYIGAGHDLHLSFGRFVITTGTTAERVPEIVKAVIEEADRLKTEQVSQAELAKVKELMRAHLAMALETSDGVADFLSDQEIVKKDIKTPEEFEALYGAVTAADIMRVANMIFDHSKLTVAVIGKGIDKESIKQLVV
jgi:predicted Zn-dependent peptidase